MKKSIKQIIDQSDWRKVEGALNEKGYSILPGILDGESCLELINGYSNSSAYRKTVLMERFRFGQGEYKYFNYPLPPIVQDIREKVYTYIAPTANNWMEKLGIEQRYPDNFEDMQRLCNSKQQVKPTVLILKYGKGGHNTLHQDLYGDIYFPMQAVLFLNEPGVDYHGGEFVLAQQTPRAQSKVIVLQPKKGDMLIFTTNFRPVRGTRGFYRVNMKHGVSELHSGERHTLGIIFHDALT